MELLAPAGTVDNFYAALQAGADAVYIGAPGINARNLSRDFTFEEIGAMIAYARARNKKVYVAANSLILERDLSALLENLALLAALAPHGLIVQDVGLIEVVRRHFPELPIHASTLMGGCSSESVDFFKELGCQRVVLARELTLKEILEINKKADTEIEVFVHGAMCYSYSGLCLFSSFLGGKSGLRGRCVQPCRRTYTWQGQGGKKKSGKGRSKAAGAGGSYVFSMNDLAAFEAVAAMKDAGIASLKIEGRMRSANYVSKIVEAYRTVIDASEAEREQALARAEELAVASMARTTSSGYFFSPQPAEAIMPHQSGGLGMYLGRLLNFTETDGELLGKISLHHELSVGDRLRVHMEKKGKRKAFTVHRILRRGEEVNFGAEKEEVELVLPLAREDVFGGSAELYKLDVRQTPEGAQLLAVDIQGFGAIIARIRRDNKQWIQTLQRSLTPPKQEEGGKKQFHKGSSRRGERVRPQTTKPQRTKPEIWFKTDSAKMATRKLPFAVDMLLLTMNKKMLSQSSQIKKYLGKKSRTVVWSLPPVILEREFGRYQKQIQSLIRSGFRSFQVGHVSQKRLFRGEKVSIFGDYTLNIANSQALALLGRAGFEGAQIAIELDRHGVSTLLQGYTHLNSTDGQNQKSPKMRLGMTVYGAPPLFTSRLNSPHFQFNKTAVSPKGEQFYLKKREGTVVTVPAKPFSLLPYIAELARFGLEYVVVDTTLMHMGEREMVDLAHRLEGPAKYTKLPTFNYLGRLE
ncbi:MAG: peptidase U32 family protein [Desulfopila sp.]